MNSAHRKAFAAAGLTAVAILGTSACSSETASEASSSASSVSSSVLSSTTSSAPAMTAAADPAADLVGTGCAGYAEQVPEGPGSVAGMAQDRSRPQPRTTRSSPP